MKKGNYTPPPRWATRFLRWYCNKNMLEDLEGDIHEFYLRNINAKGRRVASLIYILDVLKFLRIYTVTKPSINKTMKHFLLIDNYIKTSSRNLRHNPLFSLINVAGLAISMSVGLLLITFISEVYTFDTFHENAERIYRINNSYEYLGDENYSRYASTSPVTGPRMQRSVPGIESLVTLRNQFHAQDITHKDKTIPFRMYWASEGFFEVFSFQLLQGNPKTALKGINKLVITDESAKKLFGNLSPLNKQVELGDETYTVTGVVASPPMNSHLQFEVLVSYETHVNAKKGNDRFLNWTNMWEYYVYFKLREGQSAGAVQDALDKISEEENSKIEHTVIRAYMQPLLNIVPGDNLNNAIGTTMEAKMVWTLVLLSIVVIISACFNYTNLSLGRSMRRSMEVGVRKVNGATGFQVWLQFIVEATIISLVALIVAIGLFTVLRDYFFTIDQRMHNIVTLQLTRQLLGYFLLMALFVGVLAGFFPALFFSRVTAFKVLKDISKTRVLGQLNFKKTLILLQYTISLSFIVAVTLIYKQYRYSLSYDLGYNTENILNLRLFDQGPAPLANEFKQFPEVKNLSQSAIITSVGNYRGSTAKYKNLQDSAWFNSNKVDENYLPIHGHQFLAGDNFLRGSESDSAVNNQVIVNEALLKRFNMGTPEQALGEEILISGNKKVIHGVLKDFQYGRLDNKIGPFVFEYGTSHLRYINLLIGTDDIFNTMDKIGAAWKKFDPVHPMEASFYEDRIKGAYEDVASLVTIMGFMAFLAVSIASMGLLGMVVFTTESRLKEIGIRKVFGATGFNLVYLLARGFILLLVIAATVAIPLAYYYVNAVIFEKIVYKASFGLFDLMLGVVIVIGIALMAICLETFRAARINPAAILRNE